MAQQLQVVLDGETETIDLAELNIADLDPQQDRREVVEIVAERLQIEVTNTYTEHWVIAWNPDRTYHDFVRCPPDRSQDEAEAFRGDERGLSTTVEVDVFANFAAAQAAAGKRINELEMEKTVTQSTSL